MKKALLLFVFVMPFMGFAATFTVTSNAGSGPGSLYDAVLLASQNGTTVTDTILFNLPAAQRGIILTSPLQLSSNLVIDGTSQPTPAYGLSDARVQIIGGGCTTGFLINQQNHIEIYGLWFTDFNQGSISCLSVPISLRDTHWFTLGKPGKGNSFTNNRYSVINPWQFAGDNTENTHLTIQSNRFGIDTLNIPDYSSTTIAFGACRQFWFGGDDPAEGNRVGNGFVNVGNMYIPLSKSGDTIAFKNNSFGFDAYNGPLQSTIGFYVAGQLTHRSKLNVIVDHNKIGKDDATNKMWFTDIEGNIDIRDNYIGSLNTVINPGDLARAIYLYNCKKVDSISIAYNTINGYKTAISISASPEVTITNNSIYCNQKGIEHSNFNNIPIISFLELTATRLKGTTTPFSKVEIFSTSMCTQYCENGQLFLTSTTADANGVFEYNGVLPPAISATATSPAGTTGEFYGPKFTLANVEVKNATCNLANGYIRGVSIIKANSFKWEDENGNVVGTDTALTGMRAGRYRLVVSDTLINCPAMSPYFTITEIRQPGVDSVFEVTNSSCDKNKGIIELTGNRSPGSAIVWQDSLFQPLLHGVNTITDLAEGVYHCKVYIPEDSTCFTSYGPFTVLNTTGPFMDVSQAQVNTSLCNGSTGSVKNITIQNATGPFHYKWEDSTGKTVATTLDLIDAPAGKYRLLFKDGSFCDTLVSSYYTIMNKGGITIDSSDRLTGASGCNVASGYIKQLHLIGADKVEWIALPGNTVVGNKPDLENAASGYYQLAVFNLTGCTDTSTAMFIPQAGFTNFTVVNAQVTQPNCNLDNGRVELTFSADTSNYQFAWTDSIQNTLASATSVLGHVADGNYYLVATDSNSCKQKLYSVAMSQTGIPAFDYNNLVLVHDSCGLAGGAIQQLNVTGGQTPYNWQWFLNNSSTPFQQLTQPPAQLKKGNYHAVVTDVYGCSVTSRNIVIGDFNKQLAQPHADDKVVLRNTTAELVITNYNSGSYSLFDTLTASLPLQITSGSRLVTPRVQYNKTFYLQHTQGNCVSALSPVMVKVYDKASFSLANAFSPNGDGINDVWKLQVQGPITIKEWRVFNRSGQQVYSSTNVGQAWDGTVNGKPVPVGTYYWIITASDNEGNVSHQNGSVTVLR